MTIQPVRGQPVGSSPMRFGPPGNNSASISVLYGPSLAAKQTLTQCRAGHDEPATLKLGCVSVSARRLPLRLFLLLLPHLLQPRGDAGGNGLGLVLADVADDGCSDVVGIVALDVELTFGLLRELRL